MSKILILGDGLLGSELHSLTGWDIASRKKTKLDIKNFEHLENFIKDYTSVINCIAHTDSYSKDREIHREVNYEFPAKLSDFCKLRGTKLVHISTEFVYANNPYPPTEEDLPLPYPSWYAYTKLLADEYISLTNKNALICRLLHKPNPFPYSEVWNVKTSGDLVNKIAILVKQLIEKNAKGIFNVGTGDKILSDLAPNAFVIEPPSHVPKDTRMNLDKLKTFIG